MPSLRCSDYGFDCDFIIEGKTDSQILQGFGQHTEEEHGIEYSEESLMRFIIRKKE